MLMLIITRTKKNNHKLKNVEKGRNRLWMISCVKQKLLTERKNKKERKNERCIEVWHHHVSNLAFFSLFPPSFLLILLVATAATSFFAFFGDGFRRFAAGVAFLEGQTAGALIGGGVTFRPRPLRVTTH